MWSGSTSASGIVIAELLLAERHGLAGSPSESSRPFARAAILVGGARSLEVLVVEHVLEQEAGGSRSRSGLRFIAIPSGARLGERAAVDLAAARARAGASRNSTTRGPCTAAAWRRSAAAARSAVTSAPVAATTTALRRFVTSSSGTATTTASSTAGWRCERGLDLAQLDAVAARLHLVIAAAEELEVAVRPLAHEVTGAIGVIAEPGRDLDRLQRQRRAFGAAPVALHHRRAADPQLAGARPAAPARSASSRMKASSYGARAADRQRRVVLGRRWSPRATCRRWSRSARRGWRSGRRGASAIKLAQVAAPASPRPRTAARAARTRSSSSSPPRVSISTSELGVAYQTVSRSLGPVLGHRRREGGDARAHRVHRGAGARGGEQVERREVEVERRLVRDAGRAARARTCRRRPVDERAAFAVREHHALGLAGASREV